MKTKLIMLRIMLLMLLLAGAGNAIAQVGPLAKTGNMTVCLNSTEPYGVMPTANSTYNWTFVAGSGGAGTIIPGAAPNNLISINWTSIGTCTLQVTEKNSSGCEVIINSIIITVAPLPLAPTITTPLAYCQNATAVPLTATGTGLLWYTTATGGTGSSTAPTPSTATVGSTSYWVSQTNASNCEGPRATIVVTVNALPLAPTITTPLAYCQNATAVPLTATGTGLLWYTSATGGTGSSTAPTPSTATVGNTSYWVSQTNASNCEGPRAEIVVTVNALPLAPTITTPLAYCQNATAVPLTATGTGLLWYTSATGGTGSSTAPTPSTTTVGNTSYWVSQTNASNCEGPRAEIVVTVNALPLAPTITTPLAYCQNATAVPLTATGTGLLWYTTATGGTGSSTAPTPSTATVGSTSYWVSQTNASNCEGPRAAIVVTVNALPLAPTITTPLAYCQNATAVPLTATGTGLLWYTSATGGTGSSTAPTPSTATVGSTSYWVSQTNASNCEGPRTEIVVTVNALPVPTITGTTPVCATTKDVVYTTETGMSNYVWTISAGGTITSGGTTDTVTVTWNTAGSQTISVNYQNANGCDAGTPTSKTITVDALPTASPIFHN